jgi:hypothetical protein
VDLVDGGRGRDALWLTREDDGARVIVWRSQVAPLPLCTYCGQEGHTASTGNAKTCSVRATEVAESRARASARMKERWRLKKAGLLPAAPAPTAPAPENEAPF